MQCFPLIPGGAEMDYSTNIDPLTNAAKELFGLSYLFPYQRLVITNILEAAMASGIAVNWPGMRPAVPDAETQDNEANDRASLGRQIVILPTGAGKSLCFQLPAMMLGPPPGEAGAPGITLVIYPILSLMADQERRLSEKGFSPVVLRGGQSAEEREAIWQKLRGGQSKFIIANPEVLLTAAVREKLPGLGIIHTVIDEAHCVSEWGESFRPSYLEIHNIVKTIEPPLVTAFTATASGTVLQKIGKYIFGDEGASCITGNPDRPNIEYRSSGCILRDFAVRDLLLAKARPAIVFCSSRPGIERLAKYLRNNFLEMGLPWAGEIRFYHAGLSREEKKEVENWYFGNSEAVLAATCAYGLGVDKADIRTVIHRDCPPNVEAYLQESGRAGRDGKQSQAYLLWGPEDDTRLKLVKTAEEKARLGQLFSYARNTVDCRREALLKLLNYEGENSKPEKNCCDVCGGDGSAGLREEKSFVGFFMRNKRLFTESEAAVLLSGTGYNGAACKTGLTEGEVKETIRALLKKGSLVKCKAPFWKGKISIAAKMRTRQKR